MTDKDGQHTIAVLSKIPAKRNRDKRSTGELQSGRASRRARYGIGREGQEITREEMLTFSSNQRD